MDSKGNSVPQHFMPNQVFSSLSRAPISFSLQGACRELTQSRVSLNARRGVRSLHISGFLFKTDPKKICKQNKNRYLTAYPGTTIPFMGSKLWITLVGFYFRFRFYLSLPLFLTLPYLHPSFHSAPQVRGQSTSSGLSICVVSF